MTLAAVAALLLSGSISASPKWLNLYIPEFDNLRNDPSVAWLSSGFVDILSKKFTELDGVRVYGRPTLEKILQDKSSLLTQRVGTENVLVMGTFTRELDQVTVNAQIINVANWDELGIARTIGSMNNLTILGDDLFSKLTSGLKDQIPPSPKAGELQSLTGYTEAPELNRQTREVGSTIEDALSGLEKAMDVYIGARGTAAKTEAGRGKFSRRLDFGTKDTPAEPASKDAMILEEILKTVAANPYSVDIGKPKVEVDPKGKGKTVVLTLPVKYSLKENLIGDMLRSLPYTGVKHDGTLTSIEFARNKFPISGNLMERINKGEFRIVPVVLLLDQSGAAHTTILDTGDPYWQGQSSRRDRTKSEHIFSPLVAFTVSGWSLQVTMEAVNIEAEYIVEMARRDVAKLSEVVVEFVPEADLRKFLATTL
ncbi:MAG: hypothetical protein VX822_02735 [Candidatus Neomarinimicrobiota bacterium]|nr:hypothetical protein [Candidatus Neomarinimicrobiota bacterium]